MCRKCSGLMSPGGPVSSLARARRTVGADDALAHVFNQPDTVLGQWDIRRPRLYAASALRARAVSSVSYVAAWARRCQRPAAPTVPRAPFRLHSVSPKRCQPVPCPACARALTVADQVDSWHARCHLGIGADGGSAIDGVRVLQWVRRTSLCTPRHSSRACVGFDTPPPRVGTPCAVPQSNGFRGERTERRRGRRSTRTPQLLESHSVRLQRGA